MAGLSAEGLTIKSLTDTITDMSDKIKARINPDFTVAEDSVAGVFTGIVADAQSTIWEAVQMVYNASYPRTATDVSLDYTAGIVNVVRIPAAKSSGNLEFTGTVGTTVPVNTAIKVPATGDRYFTSSALTLATAAFSDITFNISTVANSTVYTMTINNIVISITSGGSATANSILLQLQAAINSLVTGVTTSLPTSTTLRVNVTEPDSTYPLIIGARIGVTTVSNLVNAVSEFEGVYVAPVGTVNEQLVPIFGISSVTNLKDMFVGRLRETDNELRVRRYNSVGIIGASTYDSILSNIRNIEGVTAAFIIENKTGAPDVDGRPSHSFELVVEGGDASVITEVLWKYHPLGIQTWGDITSTTEAGFTVRFSRPTTVYIKMEIDYTLYSEEDFTATGAEGIKDAAVAYGNTLQVGQDVIPQRFFGNIFSSVSGIASLVVRVAKSYDNITYGAFQTTPIAIGAKENSIFDLARIVTTEV
jgi:uncharacterized phage protein gp47/JayE